MHHPSNTRPHPYPYNLQEISPVNSSHGVAANIVSYERIGSSQESRIAAVSQGASHSSSGYDESMMMNENPRSQLRFQEFIARTRHLESLEILQDIKKRMVFVEELSVAHNHKLSDQFQQLQKKVEIDACRAINLSVQANTAQSSIISELRKKLDHQQLFLERLERKLDGLSDCIESVKFLKFSFPTEQALIPSTDEGITLEQYLSQGRRLQVIDQSRLIGCEPHLRGKIEDLETFDFDLWHNSNDTIYQEPKEPSRRQDEVDPELTPPITWSQYC